MNRDQAKNLVATLRYIDAVAESCLMQTWDDERDPKAILAALESDLEELTLAITSAVRNLPTVDPTFAVIIRDVDREAIERGRIWSQQRAEKIALLRLSGDDTPEDQIPI